MKRLSSLVAAAAALLLSIGAAEAHGTPRVVAIIAATTAADIGNSAQTNLTSFQTLLERDVSGTGKIDVVPFYVSGADFSCETIETILSGRPFRGRTVVIGPGDAVIFYYAGHGYHDGTQPASDKFPKLMCSRATLPDPTKDLSLSGIAAEIAGHHPRFVLAIADSCNAPAGHVGPRGGPYRMATNGLSELFVGYKGVLMFSASLPGQVAYYRSDGKGSLFTNQFLDAIGAEMGRAGRTGDHARWEEIERAAVAPFVPSDDLGIDTKQVPQSNNDDPKRGVEYCGACTAGAR